MVARMERERRPEGGRGAGRDGSWRHANTGRIHCSTGCCELGWGYNSCAWSRVASDTCPRSGRGKACGLPTAEVRGDKDTRPADPATGACIAGASLARGRGHSGLSELLSSLASAVLLTRKAHTAGRLPLRQVYLAGLAERRGWRRRWGGGAPAVQAAGPWPAWGSAESTRPLGFADLSCCGLLLVCNYPAGWLAATGRA